MKKITFRNVALFTFSLVATTFVTSCSNDDNMVNDNNDGVEKTLTLKVGIVNGNDDAINNAKPSAGANVNQTAQEPNTYDFNSCNQSRTLVQTLDNGMVIETSVIDEGATVSTRATDTPTGSFITQSIATGEKIIYQTNSKKGIAIVDKDGQITIPYMTSDSELLLYYGDLIDNNFPDLSNFYTLPSSYGTGKEVFFYCGELNNFVNYPYNLSADFTYFPIQAKVTIKSQDSTPINSYDCDIIGLATTSVSNYSFFVDGGGTYGNDENIENCTQEGTYKTALLKKIPKVNVLVKSLTYNYSNTMKNMTVEFSDITYKMGHKYNFIIKVKKQVAVYTSK